jgi:apolipoprotein N-acyltransferase
VRGLAAFIKRPLLVGAPREETSGKFAYYNSAALFSEDGRFAARYDKIHLVPFGEYIPLKDVFAFVERFAKNPIGDFAPGKKFTVFNFFLERRDEQRDVSWRTLKKVRFSCLICFEDIFPELASNFVKEGASFLVNITNDAWFGKTAAAYQHAECSVFRAVENRVPVIRAANTGLSCFIDQKGRITDTVSLAGQELFVDGFKTGEITLARPRTFYSVYGDVFAYGCIIFSMAYIAVTGLFLFGIKLKGK